MEQVDGGAASRHEGPATPGRGPGHRRGFALTSPSVPQRRAAPLHWGGAAPHPGPFWAAGPPSARASLPRRQSSPLVPRQAGRGLGPLQGPAFAPGEADHHCSPAPWPGPSPSRRPAWALLCAPWAASPPSGRPANAGPRPGAAPQAGPAPGPRTLLGLHPHLGRLLFSPFALHPSLSPAVLALQARRKGPRPEGQSPEEVSFAPNIPFSGSILHFLSSGFTPGTFTGSGAPRRPRPHGPRGGRGGLRPLEPCGREGLGCWRSGSEQPGACWKGLLVEDRSSPDHYLPYYWMRHRLPSLGLRTELLDHDQFVVFSFHTAQRQLTSYVCRGRQPGILEWIFHLSVCQPTRSHTLEEGRSFPRVGQLPESAGVSPSSQCAGSPLVCSRFRLLLVLLWMQRPSGVGIAAVAKLFSQRRYRILAWFNFSATGLRFISRMHNRSFSAIVGKHKKLVRAS